MNKEQREGLRSLAQAWEPREDGVNEARLAWLALKALEKMERYEAALREIAYHHPKYYDPPDWLLEEEDNCPECQRAKTRGWPPSGKCTDHYTKWEVEVWSKDRHAQDYHDMALKQIAWDALRE